MGESESSKMTRLLRRICKEDPQFNEKLITGNLDGPLLKSLNQREIENVKKRNDSSSHGSNVALPNGHKFAVRPATKAQGKRQRMALVQAYGLDWEDYE